MAAATQSLNEITRAAARINGQAVPALAGMANDMSATARNASSVLNRVGDAPQSLLFGLPPAAPGPGESGFAGFGTVR
jgi:phospholipid/cholesterol/gamma-HCH transport system substrate-binding protein